MQGSFTGAMEAITAAINENKEFLTDLDRAIGDADHGINLSRGFNEICARLKASPPPTPADGMKSAAMALISTVGGASGPLYGTAFLRAAKAAQETNPAEPKNAARIFRMAVDGVEERGKAVRGDKTMVDALEPACEAFQKAAEEGLPLSGCLEAAAKGAEGGAEYTKTIAARKGRASYLGERSIGHQDPGAASVTILLKALAAYCRGAE